MNNNNKRRIFKDKDLAYFIYMLKGCSAVMINNLFRIDDFSTYQYEGSSIRLRDINDIRVDECGYFYDVTGLYNQQSFFFVNETYIKTLISFYELMQSSLPLNSKTTVYRGCKSLDTDGTTGLVCTSKHREIANQFEDGTFLKINVPADSIVFDVDITPITSNPTFSRNEHEVILSPYTFEIKQSETINDCGRSMKFYDIDIVQINLLTSFYKSMADITRNYTSLLTKTQKTEHKKALILLKEYILDSDIESKKDLSKRLSMPNICNKVI